MTIINIGPGGGSPGGSNTQVQFNDSGSFAGSTTFTWDKTNNVLSLGANAATRGKLKLFGSTSGDATIQPAAAAGTSTVLTLPASTTTLAGLGVAQTWTANQIFPAGSASSVGVAVGAAGVGMFNIAGYVCFASGGNLIGYFSNNGLDSIGRVNIGAASNASLAFNNGSGNIDLALVRDAANILGQRNGTNAQIFRVYNTFTDASNYERGKVEWASNVLRIGTESAGTGSARALELQTANTTRFTLGASGGVTIADANDVAVGTTTGTKIGTATSQKIGFWNAAPIAQPTTAVAAATVVANSGTAINDASTFDGYTIAQVVKALRNAGLLA